MRNKIKEIMAKVLKIDAAEVSDDISQKNTEAWDSLIHLNLILEIEQVFEVSFEPDEMLSMNSLELIEKTISAHKTT